jgi:hypothetical protein
MSRLFRDVSRSGDLYLTWNPNQGEVEEVPLYAPVTVAGVSGRFELATRDEPTQGFQFGDDEIAR